jgi:hypothetical protein
MSEKISLQDADGKHISGRFEVSHGRITVTAPDGRTKTAEIDEEMLSPRDPRKNAPTSIASGRAAGG